MKTYLLKSDSMQGEGVFFGYNDEGFLVLFDASDKVDVKQVAWLHDNMPLKHFLFENFKQTVETKTNAKIVEVQKDLSFQNFWETYNYKVGKKDKAKQIWERMTDPAKVLALDHIKKYNRWLIEHTAVEKQYPTTYLNTKAWEN